MNITNSNQITIQNMNFTSLNLDNEYNEVLPYFPMYMANDYNNNLMYSFANPCIYPDMINPFDKINEFELDSIFSNVGVYYFTQENQLNLEMNYQPSSLSGSENGQDIQDQKETSCQEALFQETSQETFQETSFKETFPENCNRIKGLPVKTQLPAGLIIPRRKPTLLSQDPELPILYCQFCQQPFSRRNSLRRHEQLHSGVKPFQCYPCNRQFSRQDIFKRHCASKRCRRLTREDVGHH